MDFPQQGEAHSHDLAYPDSVIAAARHVGETDKSLARKPGPGGMIER